MTISDFERFGKAYLTARIQFLRNYDDVVGVGYSLRESELVIIILLRKPLPIDKTFFREFQAGEFQGFPLISREPRNSHTDQMMIDWGKVHHVARAMRTLPET